MQLWHNTLPLPGAFLERFPAVALCPRSTDAGGCPPQIGRAQLTRCREGRWAPCPGLQGAVPPLLAGKPEASVRYCSTQNLRDFSQLEKMEKPLERRRPIGLPLPVIWDVARSPLAPCSPVPRFSGSLFACAEVPDSFLPWQVLPQERLTCCRCLAPRRTGLRGSRCTTARTAASSTGSTAARPPRCPC